MQGVSRLKIGVDVPWVTSWSGETLQGARPCASAGWRMAVFQTEDPGRGRPLYSMNHCRRQRESVAHMLCPMCGEATPPGDRWSLTARRVSAGALRAGGLVDVLPREIPDTQLIHDAGSIAPLHRACAEESWRRCPHLAGEPTVALIAFPDRWLVTPLTIAAEPPAGHALLARPPAPFPIIAFLQLYGLPGAPTKVTGGLAPRYKRAATRQDGR